MPKENFAVFDPELNFYVQEFGKCLQMLESKDENGLIFTET